jgi:hypothetical protein
VRGDASADMRAKSCLRMRSIKKGACCKISGVELSERDIHIERVCSLLYKVVSDSLTIRES